MSTTHEELKEDIRARRTVYLKDQPTQLRRCLGCDDWMRSTGPDHRVCNPCKGEPDYRSSDVGRRLTLPGRNNRRERGGIR